MEKSRAIELLEHLAWDIDNEGNCYGDALNIAIGALKAQLFHDGTTSDLISRQAAIDAAKDWYKGLICGSVNGLIKRLNALPTAQPEPPWIPCEERMPEEHEWIGTKRFGTTISDEVYVTFENPKGDRFCKHLSFQNGKLSSFDQSTIDAFYKGSKPIAWMPLPKPFEGGIK